MERACHCYPASPTEFMNVAQFPTNGNLAATSWNSGRHRRGQPRECRTGAQRIQRSPEPSVTALAGSALMTKATRLYLAVFDSRPPAGEAVLVRSHSLTDFIRR